MSKTDEVAILVARNVAGAFPDVWLVPKGTEDWTIEVRTKIKGKPYGAGVHLSHVDVEARGLTSAEIAAVHAGHLLQALRKATRD